MINPNVLQNLNLLIKYKTRKLQKKIKLFEQLYSLQNYTHCLCGVPNSGLKVPWLMNSKDAN